MKKMKITKTQLKKMIRESVREQMNKGYSMTRGMDSAQRIDHLLAKRAEQFSLGLEDYKQLWEWIKTKKIDFRDFVRFIEEIQGE